MTYDTYIQGGSTPSPLTHSKTTMSIVTYVARQEVVQTGKNGKPKVYRVGTVIKPAEWSALKSDHARSKFSRVERDSKKIRWTGAELDLGIATYLKYTNGLNTAVNNEKAAAEVSAVFPKRAYGAVNMLFTQIRALDTYVVQGGLTDTSQTLVDKLYAIDPDRFPGGATHEEKISAALDILLSQVLASA